MEEWQEHVLTIVNAGTISAEERNEIISGFAPYINKTYEELNSNFNYNGWRFRCN